MGVWWKLCLFSSFSLSPTFFLLTIPLLTFYLPHLALLFCVAPRHSFNVDTGINPPVQTQLSHLFPTQCSALVSGFYSYVCLFLWRSPNCFPSFLKTSKLLKASFILDSVVRLFRISCPTYTIQIRTINEAVEMCWHFFETMIYCKLINVLLIIRLLRTLKYLILENQVW